MTTLQENKKIESYQIQKTRHSNELNNQEGIFFAFSQSQLEEGLKKVKANRSEITSIGAGGFIRKDEAKGFIALMDRHAKERKEIQKNTTELINAITYELCNHEYCITGDVEPALESLELTSETVCPEILKKAIRKHNKKK